ncbi:nuclear transport factor 2 family protein [Streptomyces platensis]
MTTFAPRAGTDLYVEVQQFYAAQMQRLDERDLEAYAATFTENGEFRHTPGREPARGRQSILDDLRDFHRQFESDPMQRRHWFNMTHLEPQDDGSIRSTVYALIVKIRPGQPPEVGRSCVVRDILVREHGELRNLSRWVDHD